MKLSKIILATAAGVTLVAGGTAAYAATAGPVDSGGLVHGCYSNKAMDGTHTVWLQDAGTSCPNGTTPITWNQQGQPGPQGPAGPAGAAGATGQTGPTGPAGAQGPTGPAGPAGTSLSVAPEPSGNNCAQGGISVQASLVDVGYVCNGAVGPQGPQGIAGPTGPTGPTGRADRADRADRSGRGYHRGARRLGPDGGGADFAHGRRGRELPQRSPVHRQRQLPGRERQRLDRPQQRPRASQHR